MLLLQVYRGDCWQHLRNILISAMADAGNAHVKELVADDLAEFSSFERVEIDGSSAAGVDVAGTELLPMLATAVGIGLAGRSA